MGYPQSTCDLIAYLQALYDASGRPAGKILYRASAGWYVRIGKRYERLGSKWTDVEYKLRTEKR